MTRMTIGQVAHKADVGTETIRFYEKRGLIPKPERSDGGYRLYPVNAVARLAFIQRAKSLGFSLQEIQELLNLRHDPASTRHDVYSATERHLQDIQSKIADLERMAAALQSVLGACEGHGPLDDCPILAMLDGEQSRPASDGNKDQAKR